MVCINDVFAQQSIEAIPNRPVKNKTYVVREIRYYDHLDKAGVLLQEIRNPQSVRGVLGEQYEPSFSITRFAPLEDLLSEITLENVEEMCV